MLLVKILGSKNLLCAHGRAGQTQLHIFLRRISQSEIRNLAAAEKSESESEGGSRRRNFVSLRDKQKFLLFACPVASRGLCYGARPRLKVFQNSAFGFSLKKVRISFSVRSQLGRFLSCELRWKESISTGIDSGGTFF